MVNIQYNSPVTMPTHVLKANKELDGFAKDTTKKCYIAKFLDGRFGVMAATYPTYEAPVTDWFYKVFTEKDLHETFEEINVLA